MSRAYNSSNIIPDRQQFAQTRYCATVLLVGNRRRLEMGFSVEHVRPGTRIRCKRGYDTDPGQIRIHPNFSLLSFPKTGEEYTVREVVRYTNNVPGLLLVEVQNPTADYGRWSSRSQPGTLTDSTLLCSSHHGPPCLWTWRVRFSPALGSP